MAKKRLITADMSIADALKQYPGIENVLTDYKMHCVDCEISDLETIGVCAATHSVKDIEQLLDDLNEAASQ